MFLNLSFVIEKEIIYLSQVRQQQRSAMCISLTRCCHQRYASWLGHLLRSHSVPGKVVFLYTPLLPPSYFVRLSFQLSVCSFVHVLDQYFLKHSTIFFFFYQTWYGQCIIMRWCVMQRNWFTLFKVKAPSRTCVIKIWLFFFFYHIFESLSPFATKLGLIVTHQKPECPVQKWHYCIQGKGHS